MNDFDNDNDLYELTAEEGKRNAQGLINALLYLVLAAVVLITGAHAVMLVLSQTAAYSGGSSLVDTVLTAIRVTFPLLVELAAVVATWPFSAADRVAHHTLFIAFLGAPPNEAGRERLMGFTTAIDAFHIDGREVYWLRRDALGESQFAGGVLEKALGMPATVRNGRTVGKIAGKYVA